MGSHLMKPVLLISLLLPLSPGRSRSLPACAILIAGGGLDTSGWQLDGDISREEQSSTRHQVTTVAVTRGCSVTAGLSDNTTQIVHSSPCSASGEEIFEVIDKHEEPAVPPESIQSLHCQCEHTCNAAQHKAGPPLPLNLLIFVLLSGLLTLHG